MLSRRIVRGVEPVALWDKLTCELRKRNPNFNDMVTKIWTHTGVGSSKNGKLTKVLHRNSPCNYGNHFEKGKISFVNNTSFLIHANF